MDFVTYAKGIWLAYMYLCLMAVPQTTGQYYGRKLPCPTSYLDPDGDCLAGIGGKDYPMLSSVPVTTFKCSGHPVKLLGYFADIETHCQVFHVCMLNGQHDTFLCPNGTLFNQQFLVCDWWFNVKCNEAPKLYSINDYLQAPVNFRQGPLNPNMLPIPSQTTENDSNKQSQKKPGSNFLKNIFSSLMNFSSSSSSSAGKPLHGSVSSVPLSSVNYGGTNASGWLPSQHHSSIGHSKTSFSPLSPDSKPNSFIITSPPNSWSSGESWTVPISAMMSYPSQFKGNRFSEEVSLSNKQHGNVFPESHPGSSSHIDGALKSLAQQFSGNSNMTPFPPHYQSHLLTVPVLPRTKNDTVGMSDSNSRHQEYVTNAPQESQQAAASALTTSKRVIGSPRQLK